MHRDIKPENFLLGNPDNCIIYLIDFGNARKYRSSKSGKHIQPFQIKRIFGAYMFLSLNASNGYQQSRRDDLEALGYMYIYLAKGELPWNSLRCTSMDELLNNTIILKRSILMEDLCKDLPEEFCDFMKYVKNLNFESKPNYEYLRSLFNNILLKLDIFTWMDNKCLTVDNYKGNNSLSKIRVRKKNSLFKKKHFNKKDILIKDLQYFNTEIGNIEEDRLKNNIGIFHKFWLGIKIM